MKTVTTACLVLPVALATPAMGQGFLTGKKPADEKKVLRNTAEVLGLDEADIALSGLEREGPMTRYKA